MPARSNLTTLLARTPACSDKTAVQRAVSASGLPTTAALQKNAVDFIIDCTASREKQWEEMQAATIKLLTDVFNKTNERVELGIVIFRGKDCEHLGRFNTGNQAHQAMRGISCIAGDTQLGNGTETALNYTKAPPATLIYIGDHYEEEKKGLNNIIQTVLERGIVAHAFHDASRPSDKTTMGEAAYRNIAQATGGAFATLGQGTSLADLCVATITYATQGYDAYQRLLASGHTGARALKDQLNRRQLGYKK